MILYYIPHVQSEHLFALETGLQSRPDDAAFAAFA